jgi:hypothetical protein
VPGRRPAGRCLLVASTGQREGVACSICRSLRTDQRVRARRVRGAVWPDPGELLGAGTRGATSSYAGGAVPAVPSLSRALFAFFSAGGRSAARQQAITGHVPRRCCSRYPCRKPGTQWPMVFCCAGRWCFTLYGHFFLIFQKKSLPLSMGLSGRLC